MAAGKRPRPRPPAARAAPLALAAVVALQGCASDPAPLPLRPAPVPYADTLPIPEPPEQSEHRIRRAALIHGPYQLADPFTDPDAQALNVDHMDDVQSSAWWERRMGYRPLSPGDVARGPTVPDGAPAPDGPLVVKDAKTQGVTPGLILEDRKGDTYIVKFDPPDFFHLQSAAGVIANRLMWGAGYHVPEDYLFTFDSARLEVDPEAEIETPEGTRPMTEDDVRIVLRKTATLPDGRYLALGSRFVPGIPKGPFFFLGTRDDDPNDHYRHEHRRDLRGLRVVSAWINNTDVREGNTLDVYVAPGYLRHYVIDFAASLGSASTRSKHPKDGEEKPVDLWRFVARVASLGAYEQGWEDESWIIPDPAVGYLKSDFEPEEWDAAWTNPAFSNMTDADAYWAAKIVAAFTDEHIRAAVETGGLPERRLEDYLVRALAERRDRTVAHWFGEVSPVEEPRVASSGERSLRLSFRDLGIEHGAFDAGGTAYEWTFRHGALGRAGRGRQAARAGGGQEIRVEWTGPADAPATDELAVLELRTARADRSPGAATVWLRWDGRAYTVAGLAHFDDED